MELVNKSTFDDAIIIPSTCIYIKAVSLMH